MHINVNTFLRNRNMRNREINNPTTQEHPFKDHTSTVSRKILVRATGQDTTRRCPKKMMKPPSKILISSIESYRSSNVKRVQRTEYYQLLNYQIWI